MVGTVTLVTLPYFYVVCLPAIKGMYEKWYKNKEEEMNLLSFCFDLFFWLLCM